jgi:Holliday junction resolvasome RuvABC DNA-binding subunit
VVDVDSLSKELERVTNACNRLAGKRDAQLQTLKSLGYDSVEKAEKALKKLQKEYDDASSQLETAHAEFLTEYGDAIEAFKTT